MDNKRQRIADQHEQGEDSSTEQYFEERVQEAGQKHTERQKHIVDIASSRRLW